MHIDFVNRLQVVIGDRKKYQWANRIGVSRGSITGVFDREGNLGSDALAAIMRCENVNISWLTEGRGAPYMVTIAETDKEAAELLETHLHDEPSFKTYFVHDNFRFCVVLTQPGQFKAPKKPPVDYTIVEIIGGTQCGQFTLAVLTELTSLYVLEFASADLSRLGFGQIGTYELIGTDKQKGLFAKARKTKTIGEWEVPPKILDRARLGVRECAPYGLAESTLEGLTKNEILLLEKYRKLPKKQRTCLLTIIDALETKGDQP